MARRTPQDDNLNIQISSGGRTVNTSLDGLRKAADGLRAKASQLAIDGMPEPPSRAPENPFRQALRFAPFVHSPEMEAIGRELVNLHHHQKWDAPHVDILYLFSAKDPAPNAWGICRKVSGLNAWMWRQAIASENVRGEVEIDAWNRAAHKDKVREEDYNLPTDRLVVSATPLYLIIIAWETWEYILTPEQRRALVDHELTHIEVTDSDKGPVYGLREHDDEEFGEIIARHGIWNRGVRRLRDAMKSAEASGIGPTEELP